MTPLSRNIIYNLAGQTALLFLGFISVKYIFQRLGEDALGVIYFSLALNMLLVGVLDKGIYSTAVREIAQNYGINVRYVRELVQTGTLLSWFLFTVLASFVFFLAPFFAEKWIVLESIDVSAATDALRILGVSALFALPSSFYGSLLRGLQKMGLCNVIDVVGGALLQIGVLAVLLLGGSFLDVVIWIAVSYLLKLIFYIYACNQFFSVAAFLPVYSKNVIKKIQKFARTMSFISILAVVQKQADKLMLSKLQPIGMLGYYGFVFNAIAKANLVTQAVSNAAYPSFCSLAEKNGKTPLVKQYWKLQDLVCFITVPIFAVVVFASDPLFAFIFNSEVSELLRVPVILLSVGFYLNGTLSVTYRLLLAMGKPEIALKYSLYAILTILPATLVLVYNLGLTGAAIGWVLYFLFGYIYLIPRAYNKCLGEPSIKFYSHISRVVILVSLTYGVSYLIMRHLDWMQPFQIITAYLAASVLYLSGAYRLASNELKATLLRNMKVLGGQIKG